MSINAFCMDLYEVTQKEYEQVMGNRNNFSDFKGYNRPVEMVVWDEANKYCGRVGKRLPTEWEWEKAAKAGTATNYYWGNDVGHNNANCNGCGSRWDNKETAPVGSFKPNPWGLYDMLGNVEEWTADWYSTGKWYKVLRGGSWSNNPGKLRTTVRVVIDMEARTGSLGFRCAH